MARRHEGQLFVGRLSKQARTRDLEELFEYYGKLTRCDIKYGAEMAYAFVDFEDRKDAEDAVRRANGKDVRGSKIVVEWAKGSPRQSLSYDECYKCHRTGHWARDCPNDSYGSRQRTSRSPGRRRDAQRRREKRRSRSRSASFERSRRRRYPSSSRSRSRSRSPVNRRSNKRSRRSPSRSMSRTPRRDRSSS